MYSSQYILLTPTADFRMAAVLQTVSDFIAILFAPHLGARVNAEQSLRIHHTFATEMGVPISPEVYSLTF